MYVECETAANAARSSLAYADGSFAPGNVDQLIASSSERAAGELSRGERQLSSASADGRSASDRHMIPVLEAGARMLVGLAREAARNHQTMPTTVLQSFGATRAELDTICPPLS